MQRSDVGHLLVVEQIGGMQVGSSAFVDHAEPPEQFADTRQAHRFSQRCMVQPIDLLLQGLQRKADFAQVRTDAESDTVGLADRGQPFRYLDA